MNNQVLIDRELLAEYLSGHGEDWVEAGHKLREILDATPAPIPDAGEVVEVVGHVNPKAFLNFKAGCTKEWMWAATAPDLKPVMYVEQHNRIVSALQASAMVVPEGYKVVPIEPTKEMMDAALMADCGEIDPRSIIYADYKAMLAASPAAKGAKQ